MGRKKRGKKPTQEILSGNGSELRQLDYEVGGNNDEEKLYTVGTSPLYGRFLQTRRNIPKGTVILTDELLFAGPLRSSGPVCLGCHTHLDSKHTLPKCQGCGWPLCGLECESSKFHVDECRFFTDNNIKVPSEIVNEDFGSIAVLRGLLLKLKNPKGWTALNLLEAHNQVRKQLPLWKENERAVVEFLRDRLWLGKFFTEDEIHTVCGILEVNAFELGQTDSYRGIFASAAMMAHDCVPNAAHFDVPTLGKMEIRAAVDIPSNTPVTICYAFSLEATAQRRRMLMETKFFECMCQRCSDPCELETNMGTLVCSTCRSPSVVNASCADIKCRWVCTICKNVLNTAIVAGLEEKFAGVAENFGGIEKSEMMLKEMMGYFHPGHFIPFGIKFNLCQAYGRESTALHLLSDAELERKLELCTEVLDTLDVIVPGMTISRGLVLYELQATEIIQARRIFESRKFSKALLKRRLEKVLKILTEAVDILSMADPSSAEHKMAASAKIDTCVDLKSWIDVLRTK